MEHQDKTNEQRKIRVLMSGGGTGGHIFPAVAIANEIKSRFPNAEFLFVGANGKMEMEKVPQAGFKIEGLNIAGFDRGNLLKNIGLPFKIISSLWKARKIIKDFKPDCAESLMLGQVVLLLALLCMWHHLSAFRFLYRNKTPF